MSWDLCISGTQRLDRQAYLTPTGTAIRIYEVFVVSSLSNVSVVLNDVVPSTTATSTTVEKLFVPTSTSTTTYHVGQYSNAMGMRFDNGVLFHTCTAFHSAVVNYVVEK